MAKRIPCHIPSLPDPTPVRGGQIIKSQASPISMDTSIMAHDLGNFMFQIADDRFGTDCCCGNNLKCRHCCTSSFNKSGGNCCYSYKSDNGDNSNAELEIINHLYSYEIIDTGSDGIITEHNKVIGTQSSSSKFNSGTGFNLCSSCFIKVPTKEVTTDLLTGDKFTRNLNTMICVGPRKVCGAGSIRLWRAADDGWPVIDCDPNGNLRQHNMVREVDLSDESSMCFDVNESAHTLKPGSSGGTIEEFWTMSFSIKEKVAPCENINCKKCV